MMPEPLSLESMPELQPGAMQVYKRRELPGGCVVEFEFAPAGWLRRDGEVRYRDWRAYYLSCPACAGSGRAPSEKRAGRTIQCPRCKGRQRVSTVSVTTICDAILAKAALVPWAEKAGIHGSVEAVRQGLITADSSDEEAVEAVRSRKLGAEAERDRAADRGLDVHAILEAFMAEGRAPNPADHPVPHRPFIRGLVKWLLWADPQPVAVEMIVGDPDRDYAGRLDLLAVINGRLTLVDLKTQQRGAIYDAAHVQAQLYREAEERYGEHEIEAGVVVVVDGEGGFREMDLIADADLARAALDFYRRIKPITAACDSQNKIVRQALAEAA